MEINDAVMRNWLQVIDLGMTVILEKNGTPGFIAKLPVEKRDLDSIPIGYGRTEFYMYNPEGMVLRMLWEFQHLPDHVDPLVAEIYLNPGAEGDRRIMRALMHTDKVHLHCFKAGPGSHYLASKAFPWGMDYRQAIFKVWSFTDQVPNRTWEAAKARCMRENPL